MKPSERRAKVREGLIRCKIRWEQEGQHARVLGLTLDNAPRWTPLKRQCWINGWKEKDRELAIELKCRELLSNAYPDCLQ